MAVNRGLKPRENGFLFFGLFVSVWFCFLVLSLLREQIFVSIFERWVGILSWSFCVFRL